jgi:hypothetical protein
MLAADVSFLAVPGVDDPTTPTKSPTTIVIYMSTLCAMGSLMISLVLASQVNNNRRSSPRSMVRHYLKSDIVHLMANINIGQVHVFDACIASWCRERLPDAKPSICSPYVGVSYLDVVSHMDGDDNERHRMIFFAVALSILIFSNTADIAALIGVAPIWALVVVLTTWPVLAANNLHISAVAKAAAGAAAKSSKGLIKRVLTIQRQ